MWQQRYVSASFPVNQKFANESGALTTFASFVRIECDSPKIIPNQAYLDDCTIRQEVSGRDDSIS